MHARGPLILILGSAMFMAISLSLWRHSVGQLTAQSAWQPDSATLASSSLYRWHLFWSKMFLGRHRFASPASSRLATSIFICRSQFIKSGVELTSPRMVTAAANSFTASVSFRIVKVDGAIALRLSSRLGQLCCAVFLFSDFPAAIFLRATLRQSPSPTLSSIPGRTSILRLPFSSLCLVSLLFPCFLGCTHARAGSLNSTTGSATCQTAPYWLRTFLHLANETGLALATLVLTALRAFSAGCMSNPCWFHLFFS